MPRGQSEIVIMTSSNIQNSSKLLNLAITPYYPDIQYRDFDPEMDDRELNDHGFFIYDDKTRRRASFEFFELNEAKQYADIFQLTSDVGYRYKAFTVLTKRAFLAHCFRLAYDRNTLAYLVEHYDKCTSVDDLKRLAITLNLNRY